MSFNLPAVCADSLQAHVDAQVEKFFAGEIKEYEYTHSHGPCDIFECKDPEWRRYEIMKKMRMEPLPLLTKSPTYAHTINKTHIYFSAEVTCVCGQQTSLDITINVAQTLCAQRSPFVENVFALGTAEHPFCCYTKRTYDNRNVAAPDSVKDDIRHAFYKYKTPFAAHILREMKSSDTYKAAFDFLYGRIRCIRLGLTVSDIVCLPPRYSHDIFDEFDCVRKEKNTSTLASA